MSPDPFEEELARVPLRPPPPAWREEILTNVLPASCRQRETAGVRAGRMPAAPSAAFGAFCSFCRTHLSPGWSAVAAVWLVILGLNRLAASGDAPSVAARPLSPDFLAAVRSQQAELLRLAELDAPVPPPPPAPVATEEKPRRRGPRAKGQRNLHELWPVALAGNSKSQAPSSKEIPNLNLQDRGAEETLELVSWSFLGALNFELGA